MPQQLKAMYEKLWWPLTDRLEKIMADLTQIQNDVAALKDAQAAAADELEALANQVNDLRNAGADNVSDEDLATLHDNLQSVTTALTAATQSARTSTDPPHPEQV